jgi:hypothetical protein
LSGSDSLTQAERLARGQRHRHVGEMIADSGDEWACVPLFYSVYHVVRDAFLNDPVFQSDASARSKHPLLTSTDNQATSHHGRVKPTKVWGVNELVQVLYPSIIVDYEMLHAASIDVRYGSGFQGDLGEVRLAVERIWTAYNEGRLVA